MCITAVSFRRRTFHVIVSTTSSVWVPSNVWGDTVSSPAWILVLEPPQNLLININLPHMIVKLGQRGGLAVGSVGVGFSGFLQPPFGNAKLPVGASGWMIESPLAQWPLGSAPYSYSIFFLPLLERRSYDGVSGPLLKIMKREFESEVITFWEKSWNVTKKVIIQEKTRLYSRNISSFFLKYSDIILITFWLFFWE